MIVFLLCTSSNISRRPMAHGTRGGGTPWEKLSGLVVPPPASTMLIVTGSPLRPKKATIAGGLGAKLRAVGKRHCVS